MSTPEAISGRIEVMLVEMRGEFSGRLSLIEERQASANREAEHRHANLKMAVEGLMPRREAETRFDGLDTRFGQVEGRIEKVEKFQSKLALGFATGAAAMGGGLYGLLKKLGIVP